MTSIPSSVYVGQTGSSLGYEHDIQWERYQKKKSQLGYTDYKSSLFIGGIDGDAVLQSVENAIEGNSNGGDGHDGNLLTWDSYLENNSEPDNLIFGSNDSNIFTNVNFNNASYSVMNERGFSELFLGANSWVNGKPYDVYDMGQNTINFTEFVFPNTESEHYDGTQDYVPININEASDVCWGNAQFTFQEVDTEYWEGLCPDADNPESASAYDSLNLMIKLRDQWLTDADKELLSEYEEGSYEYIEALADLAKIRLDQGNSMPALQA